MENELKLSIGNLKEILILRSFCVNFKFYRKDNIQEKDTIKTVVQKVISATCSQKTFSWTMCLYFYFLKYPVFYFPVKSTVKRQSSWRT